MIERIRELADSWINGNRKWVAGEVFESPDSEYTQLTLGLLEEIGDEQMQILFQLIQILKDKKAEQTGEITSDEVTAKFEEMISAGEIDLWTIEGIHALALESYNNEIIKRIEEDRGEAWEAAIND